MITVQETKMKLSRSHIAITAIFPLLFLIIFVCACQVDVSPTPTATTVLPTTTSTLPATPTFARTSPTVLSPSRTPKPSITPSLKLSATTSPVPLTAGGDWLLYQRILLHSEGGFSEDSFCIQSGWLGHPDSQWTGLRNQRTCFNRRGFCQSPDDAERKNHSHQLGKFCSAVHFS